MNFEQTDRGVWRDPMPAPISRTYCNPLPLPDYPQGRACRLKWKGGWLNGDAVVDFRETADPSVLYWQGRWYLYPSAGMAWVSEDFVTWKRQAMNIDDVGYAPTIVEHRGRFYLTACESNLYRADHPLGPWEDIGHIRFNDGVLLDDHADPMLFSDEDGRLYLYWGLGAPAIFGIELDADDPLKALGQPTLLFAYAPEHVWERYGEYNEDASTCWCEGSWMLKHKGRYYLTYTAPGTSFGSYGMGAYEADSPLGPFRYAERNPILRDPDGLVRGPGHGCIVRGPNGTLWSFYTCTRCVHHIFERRIGMDPVGVDSQGNLYVRGASETPQWGPGVLTHPEEGNATGLLPVSINKRPVASSSAPGREPIYAVDNSMRTWWQAAEGDVQPWFYVDLGAMTPFMVHAVRIIWAEPGMNYRNAPPGPMKYRLEGRDSKQGDWFTLLDRTESQDDLLVDYRTFSPRKAREIRLVVTGRPDGVGVGVCDLSVFGLSGPVPDGHYGVMPERAGSWIGKQRPGS